MARARVSEALDAVLPGAVGNAVLVTSELVANAVRHAPPADGTHVILRIVVEDQRATIIVVGDGGGDFVPSWPDDETPEWPVGRLGLRIVDRVASAWGVSNDGQNSVWAEITEPGGAEDPSGHGDGPPDAGLRSR